MILAAPLRQERLVESLQEADNGKIDALSWLEENWPNGLCPDSWPMNMAVPWAFTAFAVEELG